MACMKEESINKTGSLCDPQRALREEQSGPHEVTERPVVVTTPGNTGRAKGP